MYTTSEAVENHHPNFRDLTGQTFGSWIVLGFFEKKREIQGKRVYWLCRCLNCGDERAIRGNSLTTENSTKCRKCGQKKLPPGHAARNSALSNYTHNAKRRGLVWEISKEFFIQIIQKDCTYCGAHPGNQSGTEQQNGKYIYNGIDRVDNSVGYLISNVVPCCAICNWGKRTMSKDAFILWAQRVADKSRGLI